MLWFVIGIRHCFLFRGQIKKQQIMSRDPVFKTFMHVYEHHLYTMILDQEKIIRIKKLLKSRPKGLTISDISQVLKVNRNSIAKYLEILLITGQVEMRLYGNAKVYYLSQRVPVSSMLKFASELILVLDNEMKVVDINDHFS